MSFQALSRVLSALFETRKTQVRQFSTTARIVDELGADTTAQQHNSATAQYRLRQRAIYIERHRLALPAIVGLVEKLGPQEASGRTRASTKAKAYHFLAKGDKTKIVMLEAMVPQTTRLNDASKSFFKKFAAASDQGNRI